MTDSLPRLINCCSWRLLYTCWFNFDWQVLRRLDWQRDWQDMHNWCNELRRLPEGLTAMIVSFSGSWHSCCRLSFYEHCAYGEDVEEKGCIGGRHGCARAAHWPARLTLACQLIGHSDCLVAFLWKELSYFIDHPINSLRLPATFHLQLILTIALWPHWDLHRTWLTMRIDAFPFNGFSLSQCHHWSPWLLDCKLDIQPVLAHAIEPRDICPVSLSLSFFNCPSLTWFPECSHHWNWPWSPIASRWFPHLTDWLRIGSHLLPNG